MVCGPSHLCYKKGETALSRIVGSFMWERKSCYRIFLGLAKNGKVRRSRPAFFTVSFSWERDQLSGVHSYRPLKKQKETMSPFWRRMRCLTVLEMEESSQVVVWRLDFVELKWSQKTLKDCSYYNVCFAQTSYRFNWCIQCSYHTPKINY